MLPHASVLRSAVSGLVLMAVSASAQTQQLCASDNTGSGNNQGVDIYNSYSACSTNCAGYAFAIVQYQGCWCSDIAPNPDNESGTSNCQQDCPGYPDNKCGSESDGLFGYIPLGKEPTGTAGGSNSQPSSTEDPTSTTREPSTTSTTQQPETTSEEPESTTSEEPETTTSEEPETTSTPDPTTSTSSSRTMSSSSSSSTSDEIPTPVTSVVVVTEAGNRITQTVTSTPMVAPDRDQANMAQPTSHEALSGGAIAGVVIGAVLGVAALLIGAFLLWRRRNRNDGDDDDDKKNKMKRNTSVLSKTGLLSRGRQPSMSENYNQTHFDKGGNSVRHSTMFGAGAEGVSNASPLGSSHGSENRRHSRPVVYDQRLNPSALFANAEANGSRVSIQDQQDYSRPLGVTNPDPRPSFESRMSRY